MASWFNPNSNSMQGGVGSASVGGPKQMNILNDIASSMGTQQSQPTQSFSSRIDPYSSGSGTMPSYQPSYQQSGAPDMNSLISISKPNSVTAVASPSNGGAKSEKG